MIAHYHLPGLFEFTELYKVFLPLYRSHPEYFYEWCDIGSIYGAPADCLWGGGRVGFGESTPDEAEALVREYGISARLTFSNSLLTAEHLTDSKCNALCDRFARTPVPSGVIVHSDLLLRYLQAHYPSLYFVSSTTKVLTDRGELERELSRPEFTCVVPDFRFNHTMDLPHKEKVEFLCNECCDVVCPRRKQCYENVSRKNLGLPCEEFPCYAGESYRFSSAMENPSFIGIDDIRSAYLPLGFSQFKIEGRSLGSAVVLEFLLYYMTKPAYQLRVREAVYLDSNLDLF